MMTIAMKVEKVVNIMDTEDHIMEATVVDMVDMEDIMVDTTEAIVVDMDTTKIVGSICTVCQPQIMHEQLLGNVQVHKFCKFLPCIIIIHKSHNSINVPNNSSRISESVELFFYIF